MAINNGKDVERIMSEEIERFLSDEIKGDRLNTLSKAMDVLMRPTLLKLKQASINKGVAKPVFLDYD
jgi:flagellar biosynthesis/type III secretory pathway chaperone